MLTEKSAATVREQFVGTWKLVKFEFRRSDGVVVDVMGKEAKGLLMYDASGYMLGHLMRADRPLFAAGDQFKGTDAEVRAAFEGSMAYFGEYSVDEAAGAVIHHLQGALFPNLVGRDQQRFYQFDGDHLTLTIPPTVAGGVTITGVIVWVRVA